MQHRWLKLYKSGVWTGKDRTITVAGVKHNLDEYAAEHGISLPDAGQKTNSQVNSYADMEQTQSPGDLEDTGDGDSKEQE